MCHEKDSHTRKIAVAGVVTPRGLGDALQYCVTIKLLQKFFPKAEVTFFCPELKSGSSVFKALNLNAHLLDLGPVGQEYVLGSLLLQLFLHKSTSKREKKSHSQSSDEKANMLLRIIKLCVRLYGKHIATYIIDKYVNSFVMKSFSFDASIFGGHTICGGIYPFIHKYEALRSATDGPMVTSPVSISNLALKHYERENSKFKKNIMLKRLRHSLQKFDFIYTRGPYSLKILRDYLNIDERKVAMALDSGFGAKLIYPGVKSSKTLKKKLKILIFPRKDYFYIYKREDLYKLYLNSFVELILWLSKNFDVEVYLSSQTVDVKYNMMGGQAAVNDLLSILEKHDNKHLKYLKSVKPEGLVAACKLSSSMDLVITSYMHGGIMALSLGVPAFFILPSADIKVLDTLSFLGLDVNSFLIDAFAPNLLKTENLVNKIGKVVENLKFHKKSLENTINRTLPTIELPVKKLVVLSE